MKLGYKIRRRPSKFGLHVCTLIWTSHELGRVHNSAALTDTGRIGGPARGRRGPKWLAKLRQSKSQRYYHDLVNPARSVPVSARGQPPHTGHGGITAAAGGAAEIDPPMLSVEILPPRQDFYRKHWWVDFSAAE